MKMHLFACSIPPVVYPAHGQIVYQCAQHRLYGGGAAYPFLAGAAAELVVIYLFLFIDETFAD